MGEENGNPLQYSWRILGSEEPGGLLSIGLYKVRHEWSDLACMHACTGEGNGNPFHYSCQENPRHRGTWWAAISGVTQSQPGKSHGWRSLVGYSPWGRKESDMTEQPHFHFHALEKEMATHSSVLAWRIPGTGQPGGLPSVGSHRVGHNWSDLAAAADYASARTWLHDAVVYISESSFHSQTRQMI